MCDVDRLQDAGVSAVRNRSCGRADDRRSRARDRFRAAPHHSIAVPVRRARAPSRGASSTRARWVRIRLPPILRIYQPPSCLFDATKPAPATDGLARPGTISTFLRKWRDCERLTCARTDGVASHVTEVGCRRSNSLAPRHLFVASAFLRTDVAAFGIMLKTSPVLGLFTEARRGDRYSQLWRSPRDRGGILYRAVRLGTSVGRGRTIRGNDRFTSR